MSVRVYKDGKEYVIGGIGGEILPVGTIVDYDGVELPPGWQWLDESESSDTNPYSYKLKITSNVTAGTNVTIPCSYIVGKRTMDVYLNGEKLICTASSDTAGTNGHYIEVGTSSSISNTIKTTTDWALENGDVLEFIVRGIY